MRSLIIIEVEHGEDTDAFTKLAEYLASEVRKTTMWDDSDIVLNDYNVRVDVQPFITAVSLNAIIDRGTGQEQ